MSRRLPRPADCRTAVDFNGTFHGIPPTHRPTAARQVHVLTFDGTGLIEHLAVRDDLTLLRQLGALPHDQARP